MNEDFLNRKLDQRRENDSLRQLQSNRGIDFCSNDYLGIAARQLLKAGSEVQHMHGSTGSRLISGNYELIEQTEKKISIFHEAGAGLIFNSGYDANTGLLSCVPQRSDTIIYDYLSHASIRDGIRLSFSRSFSFAHNDLDDLEKKLSLAEGNIFVVTESVFSMDGDLAPLEQIVALCETYGAHLIVDEAHATGVIGKRGEGLVQMLGLQHKCFARIHTFGKAPGCHGAIVLGSQLLRDFLVNFSRSFIYTTALPASSVAAIGAAYALFPTMEKEREQMSELVRTFRQNGSGLQMCESTTPIQGIIIPGNEEVRRVAGLLKENGFDVRPILYPTVPRGGERLRVVLHAFNTILEVEGMLNILSGRQ